MRNMRVRTVALATTSISLAAVGLTIAFQFAKPDAWPAIIGALTGMISLIAVLNGFWAYRSAAESIPADVKYQEMVSLEGEYLRRWIALERLMRTKLSRGAEDERYDKASFPILLRDYGRMSPRFGDLLSSLKDNFELRNSIVHGASEGISRERLQQGISQLDALLSSVQSMEVSAQTSGISDFDVGTVREAEESLRAGTLLEQQGDFAAARSALERAVDSGAPEVAPRALLGLGIVLQEQSDFAAARSALERAVDSGAPEVASRALLNLGIVLREHGDSVAARSALERAVDSGSPEIIRVARDLLRNIGTTYPEQEGGR